MQTDAMFNKKAASARSKANYNVHDLGRNPRRSTTDVRKRFNKAMRRAVRQFIIESQGGN